ncbi:PTS sugar transporter subunit IIA [Hespellia stercorisuis]|uniref:Mannitol-specific phosphotransferase enzyme IIA component n=1 Tax=Hespellia stercorisuis DSM 15480 TaxID=1121950 RepID=A0A1M6QA52_9FIRM|nr:PTS sugar transporter subunit IIA [Hespellia stercorisuis]SHK17071.1 PTS system, mannitol-specific IIA component [Hespellia stercorisuis DSM 15480]
MFFSKKKKEENLELLYQKNVIVNAKAANKEEAIRMAGKMLVDTGYVDPSYVEGMVEREKTFSTYMGNGLALPHGVEAAKNAVKSSGIAVIVFPDGIDWGGDTAQIVVGIAGVGDAHLDILAQIADIMMDPEKEKELYSNDAEKIYKLLTGKN